MYSWFPAFGGDTHVSLECSVPTCKGRVMLTISVCAPRPLCVATPPADTLRYTYLLDSLVRHHHHCLLVGPSGTGKTSCVKRHLQTGLPQDAFTSMVLTFSAQTSANMTQVRLLVHCIPCCVLPQCASPAQQNR